MEHVRRVQISEEERKTYYAVASAAKTACTGEGGNKLQILAALTQLRQAARSRGVEMRLHVVYGPSAVRDLLRRWGEEETVRVFGGEGMSLA